MLTHDPIVRCST